MSALARRAIAKATRTTTGGRPEIHLSWLFLREMKAVMTAEEWRSYCAREDEVRIR